MGWCKGQENQGPGKLSVGTLVGLLCQVMRCHECESTKHYFRLFSCQEKNGKKTDEHEVHITIHMTLVIQTGER